VVVVDVVINFVVGAVEVVMVVAVIGLVMTPGTINVT
jgi:hypothetical protein